MVSTSGEDDIGQQDKIDVEVAASMSDQREQEADQRGCPVTADDRGTGSARQDGVQVEK
jgi:hypothetical protein